MKVLTFGGCHTYAYGIENINDGYFQQYINYLKTEHEDVEVKAFAPISIKAVNSLLITGQLNINEYDLILLQLGNFEFESSVSEIGKLFKVEVVRNNNIVTPRFSRELTDNIIAERRAWYLNEKVYSKTYKTFKIIFSYLLVPLLKLYHNLFQIPRVISEEQRIVQLFNLLEGCTAEIVVLEPFSTIDLLSNYLRKLGASFFKRETNKVGFKYLEVVSLIGTSPTSFLPDGVHLSEVSHKKIYNKLVEYKLL